jgi:hypothetical protein
VDNSEFKQQLAIRYSKELYLGYGKGNLYHFFYAYKRFFIEIVKSFKWCFTSLIPMDFNRVLGIYVTKNQHKALVNTKLAVIFAGPIIKVEKISFKAALFRLFTWLLKFCLYPLFFVFSKQKASLYFTLFSPLMIRYNKYIINKLVNKKVSNIYLSNDHAGDIFILSILLRDVTSIKVSYIQHGAVKPDFPINYFDEVYVYDQRYADIYTALSKNEKVQINIEPFIERPNRETDLRNVDYLICLSHQYPFFSIKKSLNILFSVNGNKVSIRFHPSDNLAQFKYFLLKMFFNELELSPSDVSYIDDFNRASYVLCASSSLLIDAYNSGFKAKLVWVKSFGLAWDYYNLKNKIVTISSVYNFSFQKKT